MTIPTVKVPLFKDSSYGESSTIQRQFLWRKFHYSKTVLTGKVPLIKDSSYGESSTIPRQLRRKFTLVKDSSYDESSTVGEMLVEFWLICTSL